MSEFKVLSPAEFDDEYSKHQMKLDLIAKLQERFSEMEHSEALEHLRLDISMVIEEAITARLSQLTIKQMLELL